LSLCSFVLINYYDKFIQSQSASKKKKPTNNGIFGNNFGGVLMEKEKLSLTTDILKELRQSLLVCDSSLGKQYYNID
jgi:hypothetical protein